MKNGIVKGRQKPLSLSVDQKQDWYFAARKANFVTCIPRMVALGILLATAHCSGLAQSDFIKIFELDGQDIPDDITVTKSSHFLISGTKSGSPLSWPFLAKADQNGKLLWAKKLNSPGLFQAEKSIAIDTGTGYLMMHNVSDPESSPGIHLLKTDEDGNELWYKKIPIACGLEGLSMDACSDGGFILGGDSCFPNATIVLVRTDSEGNKIWDKPYGVGGGKQQIATVLSCSDGGFIVAGSTTDESDAPFYENVLIFKTDKDGNVLWRKILGGTEQNISVQMIRTADGKYVIASFNNKVPNQYLDLTKVTEQGEIEWDKIVIGSILSGPRTLAELPNGDLIVSGESFATVPPYPEPPRQTAVWIVSSLGDLIKDAKYEICNGCASVGRDIVLAPDGNPVILGVVTKVTANDDFYLLKLGADGCYMPGIDLVANIETCGEAIDLRVAKGYYSYQWNTNSSDSTIRVTAPGSYSVTVWDGKTCRRKDSVTVVVKNCVVRDICKNVMYSTDDVFVPNVITANGDGVNEYFTVTETVVGSELNVFNRWGAMVYHSDQYNNDWNGGPLSAGVYFYQFTNRCLSASIKGNVTIVR